MATSQTTARQNTGPHGINAFLALGLISGAAWSGALMLEQTPGTLTYNLPRYCFALAVLVAFGSLLSASGRKFGLALFMVGMLAGIACSAALIPGQLSEASVVLMALFGAAIGAVTLAIFGFYIASLRSWTTSDAAGPVGRPAAAPRRFGMGTLMIVVLAVSCLFAIANWLHIPPPLSVWTCAFLAIIGGMQAVLNRVPRGASAITGAVLVPLSLATTWTTINPAAHPVLARAMSMVVIGHADTVFVTAHVAALGAVCGYIAGALVAGIFLLIEMTQGPRAVALDPATRSMQRGDRAH